MENGFGKLFEGKRVEEDYITTESRIQDHDEERTVLMEIIKRHVATTTDESTPGGKAKDDSSSAQKINEEEKLIKSAKEEMGEVRQENERLKLVLARLVKDYQTLEMSFFDMLQQDKRQQDNYKELNATTTTTVHPIPALGESSSTPELPEFVSLCLGRTSKEEPRNDTAGKIKDQSNMRENKDQAGEAENHDQNENLGELRLGLGLDIRFDPVVSTEATNNSHSPESSFEEEVKEEESEMWPPGKVLKTTSSGGDNKDHNDVSQQSKMKKARVSIRARCDTPTMNDGCQWRKYGQKLAKGNPCPRAYYRCTVSPTCPVRKHVQRCVDDMSILITTYEGTHNHPLPVSATAMASTTSAAISMLQSHSSTSKQDGLHPSATAPISTSTSNLQHGSIIPNLVSPLKTSTIPQYLQQQQLYFPNTSISTSNSHPTITLDLTTPRFSHPTSQGYNYMPPTNLSFSSSSTNFPFLFHPKTTSNWCSYNYSGYNLNYGNKINQLSGTILPNSYYGKQQQPFHEQYNINQPYQVMKETIEAATKAITTNPNFQSALAAALTTYVGNKGVGGGGGCGVGVETSSDKSLKSSGTDQVCNYSMNPQIQYSTASQSGIRCATGYLENKALPNLMTSSSQAQEKQSNLVPSLPHQSLTSSSSNNYLDRK